MYFWVLVVPTRLTHFVLSSVVLRKEGSSGAVEFVQFSRKVQLLAEMLEMAIIFDQCEYIFLCIYLWKLDIPVFDVNFCSKQFKALGVLQDDSVSGLP